MKRKLLDISERIDQLTVKLYELISLVAQKHSIDFFIVGATARDLIFQHGFGIEAGRATQDIDLAVQVNHWDEFEELKSGVLATEDFTETKMMQRVLYQGEIPVDIVPFGAIKEADGLISWPPDNEVRMSVLGFEDAYNDAIQVRFKAKPTLNIAVVSPTSLAALKILAWSDRSHLSAKDAFDLWFILYHYLDLDNTERLAEEHKDLLKGDFNYEQAGARLLGRDIAKVMGSAATNELKRILKEQTADGDRFPLVEDMSRGETSEKAEENLGLLKALKQGMLDGDVKV